jgi:hypothetical protein
MTSSFAGSLRMLLTPAWPASSRSVLTWLAAFAFLRDRAITDTLTDLLVDTVHRINAKADRRVSEALIDDLIINA